MATVERQIEKPKGAVTRWLLDSGPSIRWQVMRELVVEPEEVVAAERSRVAIEDWGARLLRQQLQDGGWNSGAPPSKRSSFNSTSCVLEGLLEYEKAKGATSAVKDAHLRGLDYPRKAAAGPDERVAQAIDLVATKQHQNGRWPLDIPGGGKVHFYMNGRRGTASGWNTLRSLRVLRWYSAQG